MACDSQMAAQWQAHPVRHDRVQAVHVAQPATPLAGWHSSQMALDLCQVTHLCMQSAVNLCLPES